MRAPGVWSDDGPSSASAFQSGFAIRQAAVVGAMAPILTGVVSLVETKEQAERRRERGRKANARWRESKRARHGG